MGASIAASSVIERPKEEPAAATSGNASPKSLRVKAVTFSTALNMFN